MSLYESRLGLSAWDVLHQGIARITPLSFGEANICVSVLVLLAAARLGARIGPGTLANAVLVGGLVQLLGAVRSIRDLAHAPLPVRALLMIAGVLLLGCGSGLYLGAELGAGPRDSLMVVAARHLSLRIGAVRALLELTALAAGWALGGTVGIGTLAAAIGIGPAVELSFWSLAHSPLARQWTPRCNSV